MWHQLTLLWLVFRVILFEKLPTLFAFTWWTLAFLIALMLGAFHWALFVGTLVCALLLCRFLIHRVVAKKYLLIRRGDSVEYSVPTEEEVMQRFETARVLHRMSREHVQKAGSFDADQLELYEEFFLVDTGKTNRVIPFDWIVSIETGELEL